MCWASRSQGININVVSGQTSLHDSAFVLPEVLRKLVFNMFDLTKEQQWKLMTNTEYQKVVAIIMNLATASLVLPIVFVKDFLAAPDHKAPAQILTPWAFWGWGLLAGSLFFGCVFRYASAKLVKALYGGYGDTKTWHERFFETLRDISVYCLVPVFLFGLGCLVLFLMTLYFTTLQQ